MPLGQVGVEGRPHEGVVPGEAAANSAGAAAIAGVEEGRGRCPRAGGAVVAGPRVISPGIGRGDVQAVDVDRAAEDGKPGLGLERGHEVVAGVVERVLLGGHEAFGDEHDVEPACVGAVVEDGRQALDGAIRRTHCQAPVRPRRGRSVGRGSTAMGASDPTKVLPLSAALEKSCNSRPSSRSGTRSS